MMDSVDLYPSKPPIDITIDIHRGADYALPILKYRSISLVLDNGRSISF